MRIAIAGKGGTGKTTIAGALARLLGRSGRRVLAVDADTNPNLATMLGVPPAEAGAVPPLPRTLMERRAEPDGSTRMVFTGDVDDVLRRHCIVAPDGVRLLVMGAVGHGGAG
jgi:CO dehydrogenase maturation factor